MSNYNSINLFSCISFFALLVLLGCGGGDDDDTITPDFGPVDSQAEFTFDGITNSFDGVGFFQIGDTTLTVQTSSMQDSTVSYRVLLASVTRYDGQDPVEGLTFTIVNYDGPGVYDLSTQVGIFFNLISYNDLSETPSRSCISSFVSAHTITVTSENGTTLRGTLSGVCATGNNGDFTGSFTVLN